MKKIFLIILTFIPAACVFLHTLQHFTVYNIIVFFTFLKCYDETIVEELVRYLINNKAKEEN